MKNMITVGAKNKRSSHRPIGVLLGLIAASLISANTMAHVISPEDHHAFEHKYSELCVKKELALRKKENKTTGNMESVDEALKKLCDCIAQEESKNLTPGEVRKFLREGKYPMSLMIKAGQAEEICSKK